MINTKKANDSIQKLRVLLKSLFQFDAAELDFGIYRVMNHKRKEIENFIEDDLIKVIEKEFERYKAQNQKELLEKIGEKKKEIRKLEKELGEKILKNGEIEEKFRDKPFAKEYTELKKQIEEIDITESIQSQVFNDLYNFFSRYYEDGDFISKRRYSSKQHKYAIPYNGEEVKLYWANFDQYYIKTGEIFKDYEFNQKGWKFIFRAALVDIETGNVKGNRRYFFLSADNPVKIANKTCLIEFEYKPLTNGDLEQYPVKTKDGKTKTTGINQDELNSLLKEKILSSITSVETKAILNEIQDEKTILEKHLYKYTRKITSDFFIHKNLKDFLGRELDYFITTEVLDIENLDTEKERYFDRHITRAKVVKNIGKRTIEFLSQIEEFQKLLWEKKKFVLKTDYVITTDRISIEFYEEILKNKKQLKEWKDLGFEKIKTKKDLNNKKLPIDTKYFSEDFKERFLEKLSEKGNFDDLIDGILIKSENWQALNLIAEKYKEAVQCVYIDPPYNTGNDAFLYKDKYKDSSWLSMMVERLSFLHGLGTRDIVFFISIDDHELARLIAITEAEFGEDSLLGPIIVQVNKGGRSYLPIAKTHEYIVCGTVNRHDGVIREVLKENKNEFKYGDSSGIYTLRELRNRNPKFTRKNRPNLYFSFYIDPQNRDEYGNCAVSLKKTLKHTIKAVPKNKKGEDDCWRWGRDKVQSSINSDNPNESEIVARKKLSGGWNVYEKYRRQTTKAKSIWDESSVRTENGTIMLRKLFGASIFPDNPKPVELVEKCIKIGSDMDSLIIDFFAGSGTTAHAVMKINKQDSGKRKYIIVEMADYFDTVVIPRIKKVSYSFNWKDGKPQNADGISQLIKYHYVEQYEDTLHNIEFLQEGKGQKVLELLPEEAKTEYLMKYMLKFETGGSSSFLNLKHFENPFEYKLKIISNGKGEEIMNVDLVETFNYLIGLKVSKYKFLKENGRKYVFVLGERDNRKTAIIWRLIKDIDLKKDKAIIDKCLASFNPEEVFINGDSFVKGYKPIESEFKILAEV